MKKIFMVMLIASAMLFTYPILGDVTQARNHVTIYFKGGRVEHAYKVRLNSAGTHYEIIYDNCCSGRSESIAASDIERVVADNNAFVVHENIDNGCFIGVAR